MIRSLFSNNTVRRSPRLFAGFALSCALLASFFVSSVPVAYAATDDCPPSTAYGPIVYCPLAFITGIMDKNFVVNNETLLAYLNALVKALIQVAGGLAVIIIIYGGIKYMSTDAILGKEEGKAMITNALLGLALALMSYLILLTINPALVSGSFASLTAIDNKSIGITSGAIQPVIPPDSPLQYILTGQKDYYTRDTDGNLQHVSYDPSDGLYYTDDDQVANGQVYTTSSTITGKGTNFGYNDSQDSGVGSPLLGNGNGYGVSTNNDSLYGVALPQQVIQQALGIPAGDTNYSDWAVARNAGVQVTDGTNTYIVPIVDIGPGAGPISQGVVIDQTYALDNALSGSTVTYKVIKDYYVNNPKPSLTYVPGK